MDETTRNNELFMYLAESLRAVQEWPEWKRSDFDYGTSEDADRVPEKVDEDRLVEAGKRFFDLD